MRHADARSVWAILTLAISLALTATTAVARDMDDDPWPDLRDEVFGDNRTIIEEDGAVTLEAPYRAEDAAIVPITVRIPANVARNVKTLTLFVDKNPMPVVAQLTYGPAAGQGERVLRTRIRINMYSNVRAVIETNDGSLHMATKFVKASGGCSAAAMKDADEALANLGKIKLRSFAPREPHQSKPASREAQVMVRHPNYSGLQLNQATGYYIPAKYVTNIEVKQGSDLVFALEGGISLSEDPNLRFTYTATSPGPLNATAKDSDGREFKTQVSEAKS